MRSFLIISGYYYKTRDKCNDYLLYFRALGSCSFSYTIGAAQLINLSHKRVFFSLYVDGTLSIFPDFMTLHHNALGITRYSNSMILTREKKCLYHVASDILLVRHFAKKLIG